MSDKQNDTPQGIPVQLLDALDKNDSPAYIYAENEQQAKFYEKLLVEVRKEAETAAKMASDAAPAGKSMIYTTALSNMTSSVEYIEAQFIAKYHQHVGAGTVPAGVDPEVEVDKQARAENIREHAIAKQALDIEVETYAKANNITKGAALGELREAGTIPGKGGDTLAWYKERITAEKDETLSIEESMEAEPAR